MAKAWNEEENIHLLNGTILEKAVVRERFNAGYDNGLVILDPQGGHHFVKYQADHDKVGDVTKEWWQEIPGYEKYP